MKQWLKNPNLYYVLFPVLACLWAAAAWGLAYPNSLRQWQVTAEEWTSCESYIGEILQIEPQRLAYQQDKDKPSEFDYTNVVDQYAKMFGISAIDYTLSVRGATKRAGKTTKSADLTIKTIDIERLAKFVSAVLMRWPELECERLDLDKLNTGKNVWKASLRFTFFY